MLALRLEGLTYAEIGAHAGVSRQRVQQKLQPPRLVRAAINQKFLDRCASCGVRLHGSGHIHHLNCVGETPEAYNDFDNLTLLCLSCHRTAHPFPVKPPESVVSSIMVEAYICQRCHHYWLPQVRRRHLRPKVCPKCKSLIWEKPRPVLMPKVASLGNNGGDPANSGVSPGSPPV